MTTWQPSETPSPSRTPSPSTSPGARSDGRTRLSPAHVEALLQRLEHPHDPQAAQPVRQRRAALADAVDEVLALDPQRLAVGYARTPDVARTGDVLAVRARVLVEALVVHRDLALELHVVECRHPPRAHDGEPALLVRVQPREVQVGGQSGRESHEREDDVLDARLDVALAVRLQLRGLLAG